MDYGVTTLYCPPPIPINPASRIYKYHNFSLKSATQMFQNILLMNENDRSDLLSNNNKCMYVCVWQGFIMMTMVERAHAIPNSGTPRHTHNLNCFAIFSLATQIFNLYTTQFHQFLSTTFTSALKPKAPYLFWFCFLLFVLYKSEH